VCKSIILHCIHWYNSSFSLCHTFIICYRFKSKNEIYDKMYYCAFWTHTYYPLCKILECRFQLSQLWYRKIKNLGLSTDYKSETEIRKWLRNIFGLSFLNAIEFGESYTDDFKSTIPENYTVKEFSDYLVDNYISDEGLFPPHIWASDKISSQRTTNAYESFHAKFNKSFSSPHSNIFVFVDVLTQLQIDTYIVMQNTGIRPSTTRYQKKK
jgi:hypothetical protein